MIDFIHDDGDGDEVVLDTTHLHKGAGMTVCMN